MSNSDEANEITEVTRREIIDHFALTNTAWSGRYEDGDFLGRLGFDLASMPSNDGRFRNAALDIHQHTARNNDWPIDWVFYDDRFRLLLAPDDLFLRFLCETLHPTVRVYEEQAQELLTVYNTALAKDGWHLAPSKLISGRAIYVATRIGRAAIFNEPTGWQKVDRQLHAMSAALAIAETEEQWQTVGLLCREVLISVAQEMYIPAQHPPLDGIKASPTDAKRMLDAILRLN